MKSVDCELWEVRFGALILAWSNSLLTIVSTLDTSLIGVRYIVVEGQTTLTSTTHWRLESSFPTSGSFNLEKIDSSYEKLKEDVFM